MSEENQDFNENENGSSSSDVNNDVKPETHFADEKGVPYYNRYQELSRKLEGYKDVDLDLYNRAKDVDLDEAEEALSFKQQVYSDPQKLAKVMEVLKGQQQADAQAGKTENPELKAVIQELNSIKAQIAGQNQSNWMKQYDASLESSIEQGLKNEFKDLGSLSEFERKAVMKFVDETFEADANSGRAKLSVKDVPRVVSGVLKMVQDDRKTRLGGMVKKDQSPESLKGNGSSGQKKPEPMDENQRFDSMKSFLRDVEAGKVPTS